MYMYLLCTATLFFFFNLSTYHTFPFFFFLSFFSYPLTPESVLTDTERSPGEWWPWALRHLLLAVFWTKGCICMSVLMMFLLRPFFFFLFFFFFLKKKKKKLFYICINGPLSIIINTKIIIPWRENLWKNYVTTKCGAAANEWYIFTILLQTSSSPPFHSLHLCII